MNEIENEVVNWGFFLGLDALALIGLVLVSLFFPTALPFGLFEFWKTNGSVIDWVWFSWPIFAWGTGMTAIISIFSLNSWKSNMQAEGIFTIETLKSIRAGVCEEISFRWLWFLCAILTIKFAGLFFFGFIGHLQTALLNPNSWAVGAGLIAVNAKFRDGHKYLGPLGLANSWFIGMFMFVLLFKFGLPACIIVHALYDFFIGFVRYLDMVVERGMGLGTDRPRLRILDRNEGFGDIDYLQDKVLRGRQKVVERWCREHGKTQEELSIEEILEIRDLPEWQNPLGPRTKYFG